MDRSVAGNSKYSLRREQIIYEYLTNERLTNAGKNEDYRKALILRMLTPERVRNVIGIRSINGEGGKANVYDRVYRENSLSEPTISLLSKIATGERIGDRKFAKEMLDQINLLKNAAFVSVENPSINMQDMQLKLSTEPASIKGFYD